MKIFSQGHILVVRMGINLPGIFRGSVMRKNLSTLFSPNKRKPSLVSSWKSPLFRSRKRQTTAVVDSSSGRWYEAKRTSSLIRGDLEGRRCIDSGRSWTAFPFSLLVFHHLPFFVPPAWSAPAMVSLVANACSNTVKNSCSTVWRCNGFRQVATWSGRL